MASPESVPTDGEAILLFSFLPRLYECTVRAIALPYALTLAVRGLAKC